MYRALEIIAGGLVRAQGVDLRYTGIQNIPESGGAVLAINHTGYVDFIPVIPVIVWGSQRQWTKGGRRNMGRSRIPVHVRFGLPMTVDTDRSPEQETQRLRERMNAMLLEVQDAYGPHPAGEFWVPARLGGSAPTPQEAAVIETEEALRKAEARTRRAEARARKAEVAASKAKAAGEAEATARDRGRR